jgi:hypothetical protein
MFNRFEIFHFVFCSKLLDNQIIFCLPFTSKHICRPAQQKGTLVYNEQREKEYQSKQKEKKAQNM